MATSYKDITGQTFGRLTVIEQAEEWYVRPGTNIREARWRCVCACGNETTVVGGQLRNGNTTSCGCYQAESLKRDLLAGTQAVTASPSRYFYNVKHRAESRGQAFELTFEEVCALRDAPCVLCGFEGPNSIDRIDSEGGYTPENCQPLCRMCQTIKSAFPAEVIKLHITRIYRHLDANGELETVLERGEQVDAD